MFSTVFSSSLHVFLTNTIPGFNGNGAFEISLLGQFVPCKDQKIAPVVKWNMYGAIRISNQSGMVNC